VVEGRAGYRPSLIGIVLDGKLIAALLLGSFAYRMWALEMAFDEDHSDVGPGQLLLLLAMHSATQAQAETIGYLQHFAYFKKRWLAEQDDVVSTRLVRVGSPLHLRRTGAQALSRLRASNTPDATTGEWNEERREALHQPSHQPTGRRSTGAVVLPTSGDGIQLVSHADAGNFLPFKLR
jgi:CelD/BcsL family acetyltransferase involved in cellulose biosynthesis